MQAVAPTRRQELSQGRRLRRRGPVPNPQEAEEDSCTPRVQRTPRSPAELCGPTRGDGNVCHDVAGASSLPNKRSHARTSHTLRSASSLATPQTLPARFPTKAYPSRCRQTPLDPAWCRALPIHPAAPRSGCAPRRRRTACRATGAPIPRRSRSRQPCSRGRPCAVVRRTGSMRGFAKP